MIKKATMPNKQTIDRPHIRQSACLACQNKNICRVITSTVVNLSSAEALPQLSPIARKKFFAVVDHLRREGFSFPNVRHPSQCWMHQKFGVATFYVNQLGQLKDKMSSLASVSVESKVLLKEARE